MQGFFTFYYLTGLLLGFILYSMRIISKYFSKQLILIFVMLMLVLTGLAWMTQIMSMMKFLLNYGIAVRSFLGLTMLMIPFIVSIIIPFVAFIAAMFVYNKLIAANEITVMAASTLSPRQLARPAIALAILLTLAHFVLNLWIVPATQARFYSTQWNLRYGLAHMKLQESAFTELANGLVVYVDKVSGHDLSQVMLSDMRKPNSKVSVFAQQGKLVTTVRGLSIVMTNGSLQSSGNITAIGTFDTFDMDLNVAEHDSDSSFRVRRIPTWTLITSIVNMPSEKQHKKALAELCSRCLTPLMNIILVLLCTTILLRSSLLRRRASFAPVMAVISMALSMAAFMSLSNMVTSLTGFGLLALGQIVLGVILVFLLIRK